MDYIIYHNNCPDGWAAAYICKLKYPGAKFIPLNHGLSDTELDILFVKVTNKDVLMVDYSLRTRVLNDFLNHSAKTLRILDHHNTAQAVLEGATYATFDMKRSGAGLAWDYLFGKDSNLPVQSPEREIFITLERPWWVNYVEDQDLWNWALENSQEVNAFLMVQPRTIEAWDKIIGMAVVEAFVKGVGVREYIEYYTRSVLAEARVGVFHGHHTGVVNMPYVGVSEVGAALVETSGFEIGLGWFERADGQIQFSLRSHKGGPIDVSAIAKHHGGGGHQSAAGFQLTVDQGRFMVDLILGRHNVATSSS